MDPHEFKELYFPMLKLPFPMIERTIRKMSALDVFYFSLISPEHLEQVRLTTSHALSGAGIELEVTSPKTMDIHIIPVDRKIGGRKWFRISINDIELAPGKYRKTEDFDQKINGIPMKIGMCNKAVTDYISAYVPSGFESRIALLNYCFDNFRCRGLSYSFNIPNHQISVFKPITDVFNQCEDLKIRETPSGQDEMRLFFESMKVSNAFYLGEIMCQQLELPSYVFNLPKIRVDVPLVIRRDELLAINCVYAHLCSTNLTADDLSALVVNWFNSDRTRFRRLCIDSKIELGEMDLSSIPEQNVEELENMNIKLVRADGMFAVIWCWSHGFDFRVSNEFINF